MRILSIDTSCDETAAAVTEDTRVLSNIVWSQASLHAKWGGVMPSLAKYEHEKHIDFIVNKSLSSSYSSLTTDIDAIAVTIGPGLSIALEVGINKAKQLSVKYNKPLIAVNHIEGHLLSCLAQPKTENFKFQIPARPAGGSNFKFPCFGLVISGGTTQLILINHIGSYRILANTSDDALGEALDKGARLLGLGYPGAEILEKFAGKGKVDSYPLPIPMLGREKEIIFSYSGLKTAMWKSVEKEKIKNKGRLSKTQIKNLAASFQNAAFTHLTRVLDYTIRNSPFPIRCLLVGGGVSVNNDIRKRLRKIAKISGIKIMFPYDKKLCGDNAAMIGIAAFFKANRNEYEKDIVKTDRLPRANIENT